MKIKQLFCAHKKRHLVAYNLYSDISNWKVYELTRVYECDRCGKLSVTQIKQKVQSE